MLKHFIDHPGHLFVVATLLPLASFLLIFLASGLWCLGRRYRESTSWGETVYQLFGGERQGKTAAYVAIGAIGLAFVFSLIGFISYIRAEHTAHHEIEHLETEITQLKFKLEAKGEDTHESEEFHELHQKLHQAEEWRKEKWKGNLLDIVRLDPAGLKSKGGTTLSLGFYIDSLAGLMFVMVTLIATLIHLFSIGYMTEELATTVEDHHVHTEDGHLHRRGRFGRFFMYLSLFCFSMLNLVLADNLFQVFVSWELVGVCSYLLIGFYFERQSASNAANKAFITNRIGDAGFIIGLLIIWGYIGTFNFEGIFQQVRYPLHDSDHSASVYAGHIVRGDVDTMQKPRKGIESIKVAPLGDGGSKALLFPAETSHFHALKPGETKSAFSDRSKSQWGVMPYWMLVAAGLGIFLGCVGKSAQFPLQVWLPDAMEGPTPVSALIHAATMVAAGVYLVGRCYPLFTPEVLLTIAYTGAITLFVAATIAIVATDIKKVLAYSTVSQLGYMMLALGVGGWTAGLFHLFTHAFFKALLFLGSGSVIYGCHHEQEMPKMGGLFPKMRITALTMLVGVLAIAGTPLFSGWHSKDAVVAQALGYAIANPSHLLLFLLPLVTAGITTFYMFRMWFMTFTGKPRDHHVHDHAHESPWQMTTPLIILAFFAVVVSWGSRPWDAQDSFLEGTIHHSQPDSVMANFGHIPEGDHKEHYPHEAAKDPKKSERLLAHEWHDMAGIMALGMALLGFVFASLLYYHKVLDPAEAKEQFSGLYDMLVNKWYFDHLYSVLLVRPSMIVARAFRWFDANAIDGTLHTTARATVGAARVDGRFDQRVIDWLVNLVGNVTSSIASWARTLQTGSLRGYVLYLALAAVGIFMLLSYFVAG